MIRVAIIQQVSGKQILKQSTNSLLPNYYPTSLPNIPCYLHLALFSPSQNHPKYLIIILLQKNYHIITHNLTFILFFSELGPWFEELAYGDRTVRVIEGNILRRLGYFIIYERGYQKTVGFGYYTNNKELFINIYLILLYSHLQTPSTTMSNLLRIDTVPLNILEIIMDYMEDQTLQNILLALEGTPGSFIPRLCSLKLVFRNTLNRADRAYFFSLYQCPTYKSYENNRISYIARTQLATQLCAFPKQLAAIIAKSKQYVDEELRTEFAEKIQQFFLDPLLPMPRLTRETQNCQVNSSFQSFLLQKSQQQSDNSSHIYYQIFQKLQQNLQQHEQSHLKSLIKHPTLITQILKNSHNITHSNYSSKLIPQNNLHNLVVCVFGATELMLGEIQGYLAAIGDGFEVLLEFCMRYTQFVHTVIAVQENFGFLFQVYGELCEEIGVVTEQDQKFSFYKSAQKMWTTKMSKFHPKTTSSYLDLLHTLTTPTLTPTPTSSQPKQKPPINNPQFLSKISKLTQLHHSTFAVNAGNFVYQLMREDVGQLKALLNLYQEYLVDCSVDQVSVHFCGYSEQELGGVYVEAEELILAKERQYISILKQEQYSDIECALLTEYLQQRINKFEHLLKPRTVKKIINMYISQCTYTESEKITLLDKEIERYINYLTKCHKLKLTKPCKRNFDDSLPDAMGKSIAGSTDARSSVIGNSFEVYDSDSDSEDQVEAEADEDDQEEIQHLVEII